MDTCKDVCFDFVGSRLQGTWGMMKSPCPVRVWSNKPYVVHSTHSLCCTKEKRWTTLTMTLRFLLQPPTGAILEHTTDKDCCEYFLVFQRLPEHIWSIVPFLAIPWYSVMTMLSLLFPYLRLNLPVVLRLNVVD